MKAGVIFGRFNPPTIGHSMMINKALKLKSKYGYNKLFVFLSKSKGDKKNPLDVNFKKEILETIYRNNNNVIFIACKQGLATIIDAVKYLNTKNYDNMILFCGQDRQKEFGTLLGKYNHKEFDYDEIFVVSMGNRDPDANDMTGMSASKLRNYALQNNKTEFFKGLDSRLSDKLKQEIFDKTKEGIS